MTLKKAFLILLASIVGVVAGGFALSSFQPESDVPFMILLGGFILTFLTGTAVWAGAKGYHPVVGFILGWIGPFGLLCLAGLSDRSKAGSTN